MMIEISQSAWQMGIFALLTLAVSIMATVLATVAKGSSDATVYHHSRALFTTASSAMWTGFGVAALMFASAVMMGIYAAGGVHIY